MRHQHLVSDFFGSQRLRLGAFTEPLKQLSRGSLSKNAAELFAVLDDAIAGMAPILNAADRILFFMSGSR